MSFLLFPFFFEVTDKQAERAADLIKQDNSGSTTSSSSSSSTSSTSSRTSSSSSSTSSTPAVTGRAINPNGDKAKCLQVRGSPANDAKVESVTSSLWSRELTSRISDCNNSANQRWTLVKGSTSVKLAGSNFCLDAGGSPGNGAQAKVYTVSPLLSIVSLSHFTRSTTSPF